MLLGEMADSGVKAGNTQDEPTASYRHQRESVLKITAKQRMEACSNDIGTNPKMS